MEVRVSLWGNALINIFTIYPHWRVSVLVNDGSISILFNLVNSLSTDVSFEKAVGKNLICTQEQFAFYQGVLVKAKIAVVLSFFFSRPTHFKHTHSSTKHLPLHATSSSFW